MAVIIDEPNVRTILVTAKEPKENEKEELHRLSITVEVRDPEEVEAEDDELRPLYDKFRRRESAIKFGGEIPEMTEEELRKVTTPIWKKALPYIKNIAPLVQKNGQPVMFTEEVLSALVRQPWIREPIEVAYMAVQQGISAAKYRENRTKNS
jgi:hypothetical protein